MKSYIKLALFTLTTLLAGCGALTYKGSPQFILYIEDSPADYKALHTSVARVELYDGLTWLDIPAGQQSFNLLALTGGSMLKIAATDIPAGQYKSVRITFNTENNTIETAAGELPVTMLPADATIELPMEFTAAKNVQTLAILDVQVAQSVTVNEQEQYFFKPFATIINNDTYGAFTSVIATMENVPIPETMLVRAFNTLTTVETYTYTNASNAKLFIRLPQGIYNLYITPSEASNYLPLTVSDVEITAGKATPSKALRLEAKPTPPEQPETE